jgi:hypothetical protein
VAERWKLTSPGKNEIPEVLESVKRALDEVVYKCDWKLKFGNAEHGRFLLFQL